MSEEEKFAINTLEFVNRWRTTSDKYTLKALDSIDKVLNLIEKQQEQLQEKDKIIYEMAKEIRLWWLDNACTEKVDSINEIIEYFTKKAREV